MKKMKKMSGILLGILLAVSFVFPAFSADGVSSTAPASDIRAAADSLALGSNAESETGRLKELHAQGARLFDTGSLISEEDSDKLEVILSEVSKATGMDVLIVTSNGISSCTDVEDFADLLFYEGGFGNGSEKDGTMLVISIAEDNDVSIYTHGIATRYLTDRGMNYIYDELNGGMISALGSGEYSKASAIFAQGVLELYNEGIQQNQYNVDPQGNVDPYYPEEKKGINIFEVAIAAIMSAVSGLLPVNGIKRKYAMEAEKHLAQGFNQAYKASAIYNFTQGADAELIDRFTKTIPIPRPQPTNSGRTGDIGHGGGASHVNTGRGGSIHGGSSRKF